MVRREARARAENIFDTYGMLHEILQCHEGTIRKRYLKKARSQRLRILLNAWLNMPETHRSDLYAARKWGEAEGGRGSDTE